jgi:hypothetical protein
MGGRPIGDRQQLLNAGFSCPVDNPSIPLAQSVFDHMGHAFSGRASDRLGELMNLRIFDI